MPLQVFICIFLMVMVTQVRTNMPGKHGKTDFSKIGHLNNCGFPETQTQISWTPPVLSPRSTPTVNASFIAPFDFDVAVGNATVFFYDDGLPFLAYSQLFDCSFIRKYDPLIRCPIKKHQKVEVLYTVSSVIGLKGNKGKYIVQMELRTTREKLILCAKGIVVITN